MKKICACLAMIVSLSGLYAMEHALAIFKSMKEISLDATHGCLVYSAASEDKTICAIHINKTFGVIIVDKKSLNKEEECYFTEKQHKQIFGFLACLFNQKKQENREDYNPLVKGSYSIEPQEMPKDFNWNENE